MADRINDEWWKEQERKGGYKLSELSRLELVSVVRQLYKERENFRGRLNKLKKAKKNKEG